MKMQFSRPDWVRRLNYLGESVGGADKLVSLDPAALLELAQTTTGLKEFGDEDWREPFEKLVEAIEATAQLNTLGRLMTRQELLRTLQCRLQLVAAHRNDPSLREREIKAPVFIAGQSRTGTTIIHELLSLDTRLRAPLAWETIQPAAFPNASGIPREKLAECEQDLWADIVPEFAAVHELSATLPMECLTLMAPEFAIGMPGATLAVPEFMMWRGVTDPIPGYQTHKQFLQLLQEPGDERTWLLKSPVHLINLAAVFAVYPDARVIHTHRDPIKTIPSSISTIGTARAIRSDHVDVSDVVETAALGFQFALEGAMQMRGKGDIPDAQIADVHYSDFLADPVDALAAAYPTLGLDFTDSLADAMRAYLRDKPQGKHGTHRYSPEDFGLDPEVINQQFSAYREHYGIAPGV